MASTKKAGSSQRHANQVRTKIFQLAKELRPDHRRWMELGELFMEVKKKKLWRLFGSFENFNSYVAEELWFGKSAASDIIRGRVFIEQHFPHLISVRRKNAFIPSYNQIAMLRRVQKQLPKPEFEMLKEELFKNKITRDTLRTRINSLLPPKQRKAASVDELRETVSDLRTRIRRLEQKIVTVKQLKKKVSFHLHPDRGGDTQVMQEVNNLFDMILE